MTVNDLLVAALHLTIASWNTARGRPAERIGVMVPVNLRPWERRHEVVGNFSSFVSVVTTREQRRDPEATLAAVSAAIRRIRERHGEMALIDFLTGPVSPPAWLRQAGVGWMRLALERGMDTAVLSNLGRLDDPPSFGADAGGATEVWFSPPACLPLGLAVGAVTVRGRLHLVFRYRHVVLGASAAQRFAADYTEAIARLSATERRRVAGTGP